MSLYTTSENLARKLRGRLRIADTPSVDTLTGYGQAVAGNTVDNELIDQILNQTESYINLALSQIYEVPLKLTNTVTSDIMADITESICISKLIQVHYEGTSPVSGAADVSGAAMDLRKHGELLLAAITAGHNIFTPTFPQPQNKNPGMTEIQPLVLPGEILLSRADRPDTITRNYTFSGIKGKAQPENRQYFTNKEDCGCGSREDGSSRGTEWYECS
jgi:hypothetical protein